MKQTLYTKQPEGKLLLRTLAMPSDTNANGDIFGGWIMSQMDLGRTSMQVKVEVFIKEVYQGINERFRVTEALFTYVAIDKEGKPTPVPRENNPELDEAIRIMESLSDEERGIVS